MKLNVMAVLIAAGVAALVGGIVSFIITVMGGDPGIVPTMVGVFAGIFAIYIRGNLLGTRKLPDAEPALKAEVLAFRPSAGQALLIVYREGFVAKLAGMDLTLDGQTFTQLKSPQFSAVGLNLGPHRLVAAFTGGAGKQNAPSEVTFDVHDGEVVVFQAVAKMGAIKGSVVLNRVQANQTLSDRLKTMTMVASDKV